MTIFTPTDRTPQQVRNRLADLRAELDQLRLPIARPPVRQRVKLPGGRRVTQWRALPPLPPLLDQLREAANGQNSTTRGPERRQTPRSRPPGSVDAMDLYARLCVQLSGWHSRQSLPSPPVDSDWQRYALRQLHDEARRLTPEILDALAADVTNWWRWAAAVAGISQQELKDLRRGR